MPLPPLPRRLARPRRPCLDCGAGEETGHPPAAADALPGPAAGQSLRRPRPRPARPRPRRLARLYLLPELSRQPGLGRRRLGPTRRRPELGILAVAWARERGRRESGGVKVTYRWTRGRARCWCVCPRGVSGRSKRELYLGHK
jgi:hypothetical protein